MVHEDNKELAALIEQRKKIIDQLLLFDKATIQDLPTDPWTPYFKTNNFMQRSLSHLLAFDDTKKQFRLLQADSDGKLVVSSSTVVNFAALSSGVSTSLTARSYGALDINPGGRDLTVDEIYTNFPLAGSATAVHAGIDMQHAERITVLASSQDSITLRPQISDNNTDWYDLVDETDTNRVFNVTNEKIAFRIASAAKFLRIVATNNSTAENIFSLKILGQA